MIKGSRMRVTSIVEVEDIRTMRLHFSCFMEFYEFDRLYTDVVVVNSIRNVMVPLRETVKVFLFFFFY